MPIMLARFSSGDYIPFECDEDFDEDLIYSSACHTVARYVVKNPKLLDEVLEYLNLPAEEEEELRSAYQNIQAEEIGEYLYDDQNWVTVEEG